MRIVILERVDEQGWLDSALAVAEAHGRLVTLWGRNTGPNSYEVYAVYFDPALGLSGVVFALPREGSTYPDLSELFPSAGRMQRTIWDLLGIAAAGSSDNRRWLDHGSWGKKYYPLRKSNSGLEVAEIKEKDDYSFVEVSGDGVHEIAVGPVHAGIIEPGHFRFSVVGEKILRLEERLGYVHKGVDKAFEKYHGIDGVQLAGRISGDSTVAYAWSYCMAVEAAWSCEVSKRAITLRALLLERERIANHLGDLGAIGNDAGFAFGLTQFMLLKEQWLRLNKDLFGHRFMMDAVVVGGVACDIDESGILRVREQCELIKKEVGTLRGIYDDHAGLQDRFLTTGHVSLEVATRLGMTGMAGRASGISEDGRVNFPSYPYSDLQVNISVAQSSDVAARVSVRFDEVLESLRLISELLVQLPEGEIYSLCTAPAEATFGVGWVEGWRGGIFAGIHVDKTGMVDRAHMHDPSWQNWPALEYAVIGDIVPDFPLINKSFNLSYSGHDR